MQVPNPPNSPLPLVRNGEHNHECLRHSQTHPCARLFCCSRVGQADLCSVAGCWLSHSRCVLKAAAWLPLLRYDRPFGVSMAILLAYLAVLHVLTFAALGAVARRERR